MNSVSVVASSEVISVVSDAICNDSEVVNACIDWAIRSSDTRLPCDCKKASAEVKASITSVTANMSFTVLANWTGQAYGLPAAASRYCCTG